MNEDEFRCENCKEIWEFFPEDYDFIEEDYPTICPLCSLPIFEMIRDVYKEGGIFEVIRMTFKRLF